MSQYRIIRLAVAATIAVAIGVSCTKEIHVNLTNADPAIVIEGNLTDQPGPDTVLLSMSLPFNTKNTIPPVTGARVIIKDSTAGVVDTLVEINPGMYVTSKIVGTPQHTYVLRVTVHDTIYTAMSTMPVPVPIDSAWITNFSFGRNNNRYAICRAKDPIDQTNFYLGLLYHHGKRSNRLVAGSDRLVNGKLLSLNVRPSADNNDPNQASDTIAAIDTVQVELRSVDQPTYDYFYSLNNSTNSSLTAAPANPNTQFTTEPKGKTILGYFGAYSLKRTGDIYSTK